MKIQALFHAVEALGEAAELLSASRTAANRLTMFHGTASGPNGSRLRSILKKGLIPTAPKAWADDPNARQAGQRSRAAYGGTYFTANPRVAFSSVHQPRGNDKSQYPVIITATIQPRAALPDEDDYTFSVDHAYSYATKVKDHAPTDGYYYLTLFLKGYQQKDAEEARARFAESLGKALERQGVTIDPDRLRRFTDPLFDAEVIRRVSTQPADWYGFKRNVLSRALEYYKYDLETPIEASELPIELQKQPTYEEGEARFRAALDALTRATRRAAIGLETHKKGAPERFRHVLRVMEPVTYRGRNRITSVVSLPNYYTRKVGDTVIVVSHFGDPKPIVSHLESEGYPVRVLRPGQPVDAHEDKRNIASGKAMNNIVSSMAVVLRQVSDHDWGFFSREDDRLHIQTVDKGSLYGPKSAKVWLESKGQRVFDVESTGGLSARKLAELKASVVKNKQYIESEWISGLIDKAKVTAKIEGDDVVITMYPGTHNEYTGTVPLREEFPGVEDFSDWAAEFTGSTSLLCVGLKSKKPLDRHQLDVAPYVFFGER